MVVLLFGVVWLIVGTAIIMDGSSESPQASSGANILHHTAAAFVLLAWILLVLPVCCCVM